MDLESFYGAVPKPTASKLPVERPARARSVRIKENDNQERIIFTVPDEGPVSLLEPEEKIAKTMRVENFDAMLEQIFDMV